MVPLKFEPHGSLFQLGSSANKKPKKSSLIQRNVNGQRRRTKREGRSEKRRRGKRKNKEKSEGGKRQEQSKVCREEKSRE